MFYNYYSAIKARLADQISDLKDIQKYNDQYSGSNLTAEFALIEFPDMVSTPYISKSSQRASVSICIHLVSKIMSDKDNHVPDEQYQTHDELADDVITALKEHQLLLDDTALARPLQLTGYQEVSKVRGWLITKIFFQTKE